MNVYILHLNFVLLDSPPVSAEIENADNNCIGCVAIDDQACAGHFERREFNVSSIGCASNPPATQLYDDHSEIGIHFIGEY